MIPPRTISRAVRPCKAGRSAFTLIEILVTLVLIAIVFPVAMKGITLASSVAGSARHNTEAAALAETKLNELVLTENWNTVDQTGDFGSDWPEYSWSSQTTYRDVGLLEMQVQVTWTAHGQPRSLAVTTLIYTPDAGDLSK